MRQLSGKITNVHWLDVFKLVILKALILVSSVGMGLEKSEECQRYLNGAQQVWPEFMNDILGRSKDGQDSLNGDDVPSEFLARMIEREWGASKQSGNLVDRLTNCTTENKTGGDGTTADLCLDLQMNFSGQASTLAKRMRRIGDCMGVDPKRQAQLIAIGDKLDFLSRSVREHIRSHQTNEKTFVWQKSLREELDEIEKNAFQNITCSVLRLIVQAKIGNLKTDSFMNPNAELNIESSRNSEEVQGQLDSSLRQMGCNGPTS